MNVDRGKSEARVRKDHLPTSRDRTKAPGAPASYKFKLHLAHNRLAFLVSAHKMAYVMDSYHTSTPPSSDDTFDPDSTLAFQRRMERAPEWFCSFLAGNSREKSRLRREMATMKGSVVWLVQQRRQGTWSAEERAHLRDVMRSASSVSPYLFVWVIPGSMLLLPFMAWFLDKQRKRRERKLLR